MWNYRVIKQIHPKNDNIVDDIEEITYAVHEVYYDDKGKPTGCTVDSVAPMYNETVDENWSLKQDFERQMEAFDKPILNFEDFK